MAAEEEGPGASRLAARVQECGAPEASRRPAVPSPRPWPFLQSALGIEATPPPLEAPRPPRPPP